jgi:hypothetical protein
VARFAADVLKRFLREYWPDLLCATGAGLITAGFWHFSRGLGMIFLGITILLLGAWVAYAHAKPQRPTEE